MRISYRQAERLWKRYQAGGRRPCSSLPSIANETSSFFPSAEDKVPEPFSNT